MLIDCPACARSYPVDRADIGSGRTVICPRCDARWFVPGERLDLLVPSPNDLRTPSFNTRAPRSTFDAVAIRPPTRLSSILRAAQPFLAVSACVAMATFAIGARGLIVRTVPRMAALYASVGLPVNVRGLEIGTLRPERSESSDVTVAGAIRNVARHRVPVPRLVYEVRDARGATLATWTERAPSKWLATGRTLPFVSSPHELPPESHSVLVHFETDDGPDAPIRVARRSD